MFKPENLMSPPAIETKLFQLIDTKRKVYSTEASALGDKYHLGQVYNDACDLGFTLVGSRNGRSAIFAETNTDKDADGDVQGWWYECVWPPAMKKAGWQVLIVND